MARRPLRLPSSPALRQPVANVTGRMVRHPVSSALLLFGLVLLVVWMRNNRQLPDRQRTLGILLGSFVVALSASVAPEFVTVLLMATLVVVSLDSQAAIVEAIRRIQLALTGRSGPIQPAPRSGLAPI